LLRIDPTEPSKPGASQEDSLKSYYTAGGRVVRGGGGIGPDIAIEGRKVGELERSLIQQGLFFEFATDWLQKHAAPADQLAQMVDRTSEATYGEFVTFVRQRSKQPDRSLEPYALQKQLDALQKSLGESKGSDGGVKRPSASAKELMVLRQMLTDERLDEFRTKKEALLLDVREALLGRLTSPTQRRAEQAAFDPQVRQAMDVAADESKYKQLLQPPPPAAEVDTSAPAALSPQAAQDILFPAT